MTGTKQGGKLHAWLSIQDAPQVDFATRIKSWKTGRVHHLQGETRTRQCLQAGTGIGRPELLDTRIPKLKK
jgi:hypothetical protein